MYITQQELENYLGIEFEEWDTTPDILINSIENAVNFYIGADWPNWILTTEYRELVDVRGVILNENWYNVYLKHWPVSNNYDNPILINDSSVDNNENPRVIVRGRQLMIKDLSAWVDENNIKDTWNWLTITYTAWYWTYDEQTHKRSWIPDDIKQVCLFLCATIRLTRSFTGMTNYRLWDESISIWKQRFAYDSPFVKETLAKYKRIYLPY